MLYEENQNDHQCFNNHPRDAPKHRMRLRKHLEKLWPPLDSIDGNKISGWAWNSAAPDTPVSVTVTVVNAHTGDSLLAETATADIERDDLKTSGIGNGAHGFEIMIDWSSIPDNTC